MKKNKKILMILMLIIAIFQIALQMNKSKAATIGDINYLERENKGFYSIQSWNGSEWIYVTYSITHYTDEQGVKKIAYCINPDLKGVGWISGEFEGYDVKLQNLLSDERLWRVYTNGYPYKTPSEIGVETEEDAYLATKMASYCVLRSYGVQDVRNLYRAGTTKVANESLEDIQRRGNKVIDAICNLVDNAYNGTETMQYNNILQINVVENMKKENENYYSVTCAVSSKVECSEYKVDKISEFPEGSYITNEEGNKQDEFNGNQKFKVMIPKESIKDNVTGTINIIGKCKNYPIYYAECMVGNYQNYMLCCDTYSNDVQATKNIEINANKAGLQIEKIDKDTKAPIPGVEFSIKYENGNELGIYKTNDEGKITIKNLMPGNIIITEIKTNNDYVLNSKEIYIKLEYDKNQKIVLENEKKKGTIKIIKVDAHNNEIRIPGVKFEIYNDNNECISTVITNENGEAIIEKIPINSKYTIKEIETAKEYILSEECITIELGENEIKTLTFKNQKIVHETEKLPRTGMIDISNYLYGISVVGILVHKRMIIKK